MPIIPQNLNDRQLEAATAGDGPLLITAGAGSGKTRTLTQRLAFLIQKGVPADQIVAITFTNKAAEEIKRRVYPEIKSGRTPFLGTFHSLGARILRQEPSFGRTRGYVIFDDDDSLKLIKNIVKSLDLDKERFPAASYLGKISRVKSELLRPEDLGDDMGIKIFENYEAGLVEANAFDFDDLIEKVVRLFSESPDALAKYRDQFRHILVDEYQDINQSQYELVRLLASGHRNLSVVGDDAQSIYSFRGSDFRNFLNFEKDWPEAKVVTLDQNYRSTKNIISAAGEVIRHNTLQRPKTLWTDNSEGDLIKVFGAYDAEGEAEWLAEKIIDLGDWENTAVLFRTNAQSRPIEQYFIYNQIPYQIYGGLKFYERKEIKDVVACLRYGFNPRDMISRERIESSFNRKPATELIERLPEMAASLSPAELIGFILQTANYPALLATKFKNSEERMENIGELVGFAAEAKSLEELLEKISLFQANDEIKGADRPGVKMMTIHLSKGLEFKNVFIVGVNEGLLPHHRSLASKDELEEERRLMYVAMTRAREKLFISFFNFPSRFLYEIPPELVEFDGIRPKTDEDTIYLD
ncbi:MAG: UvrD-helicase domain-containing protein [Patescibacteria group bacterium]|nr:UvrD-helicase domain-containing protein [Patescibacteria group bacterium]MCL5262153.1 UvrD-helicase domain-containing protein [Patescibacteria group bacterium]